MKNLFACLALCSVALIGSAALACEEHAKLEQEAMQEERVAHYEVAAPKDHASALTLLQTKTKEVGAVLTKNAKLDDNTLEAIHEKSYALEAAVDKLRESPVNSSEKATLASTEEAVQKLHHASEDHKEAEVRESFAALETHLAQLKTIAAAH